MRIARALALAGIDSRRKCEEHIRSGEVALNGEVIHDLGRQVDPEKDSITFRGRRLVFDLPVYYLMFKPEGYITTALDPHAKKTVYELLPSQLVRRSPRPGQGNTRVFPVGRLDKDSSGLLLFTNDGDLANRLTHPRYGIEKWYEVRLAQALEPVSIAKILRGVALSDGIAKAEKLYQISRRVCRLVIREGRNREVRRMFEALGYEVMRLCRFALGPLTLGSLVPGRGRFLSSKEIEVLKQCVGRPAGTLSKRGQRV